MVIWFNNRSRKLYKNKTSLPFLRLFINLSKYFQFLLINDQLKLHSLPFLESNNIEKKNFTDFRITHSWTYPSCLCQQIAINFTPTTMHFPPPIVPATIFQSASAEETSTVTMIPITTRMMLWILHSCFMIKFTNVLIYDSLYIGFPSRK